MDMGAGRPDAGVVDGQHRSNVPAQGELALSTASTARRLVEAPSARTRGEPTPGRSGGSTLSSKAAQLHDAAVAACLAEVHDAGHASSSASIAVAAACFRAKMAGQPAFAGERTARALGGYRRTEDASWQTADPLGFNPRHRDRGTRRIMSGLKILVRSTGAGGRR